MQSIFKDADSILSVTLRKNQFSTEENSFVGRVSRNTITLENLIASISRRNEGISPFMIQHVANLLGEEVLIACQSGKAVSVLGLGTMYISVDGSVAGENPGESSIPGFKLNFTPSARAQAAVESIRVDKVILADSNPVIDRIINKFDQNEERRLMVGKGVRITGEKLKLLGEASGIWFAPVDEDGSAVKDEDLWVKVSENTLSFNNPKSLEFYVPDSLKQDTYRIVLRTRYCSGSKELKNPVMAISKTVSVE